MKKSSERIIILRVMAVYSITMLGLVILCILTLTRPTEIVSNNVNSQQAAETEYVYVKIPSSTLESEANGEETEDEYFTIREYMGKIGVFSDNGSLIQIIEVYVKTLPEADKRLLGEGFTVIGKKRLNSIIEDYSE